MDGLDQDPRAGWVVAPDTHPCINPITPFACLDVLPSGSPQHDFIWVAHAEGVAVPLNVSRRLLEGAPAFWSQRSSMQGTHWRDSPIRSGGDQRSAHDSRCARLCGPSHTFEVNSFNQLIPGKTVLNPE